MERLKEILGRVLEHIDYENETMLLTNGKIDSIELVELVEEIEEHFQIEISLDEMIPENFDSMHEMWNMIQKLRR